MTTIAVSNSALSRTVFRAEHSKDNPYTVISNKLLRDHSIKRSDKGLLVELLSWSDKHRVCIQALIKKGKEGRDAIQGMLSRLESAGYIKRTQIKNNDGTFGKVIYQIYESPLDDMVIATIEDSKGELSANGTPNTEAQLGFDFDHGIAEEMKDTANGFSVDGKDDTNKYNDLRSNLNSSNNGGGELTQPTEEEILNRFPLKLEGAVQARLLMSNLNGMITTQKQLDRYLLDFNINHDQYKNLTDHKRLNNFIHFLSKIHASPAGQRSHQARLRAAGFVTSQPVKSTYKKQKDFSRYVIDENSVPTPVDTAAQVPVHHTDYNFEGF